MIARLWEATEGASIRWIRYRKQEEIVISGKIIRAAVFAYALACVFVTVPLMVIRIRLTGRR